MTPAAANTQRRQKLDHRVTCGVPSKDDGTLAPAGYRWCVRCGVLMSNERANAHRQARCRTAASYVNVAGYDTPEHGCQRIIEKPPRLVAPRARKQRDPIDALKQKREAAAEMLSQWERRLTLALGKMKHYRNVHRRASAQVEAAIAEREQQRRENPAKTRQIKLRDAAQTED